MGTPQAVTSLVSGVYGMYLNFVGGNLSPTFRGAIALQLMDVTASLQRGVLCGGRESRDGGLEIVVAVA